jgi:hypothetical protein
MPFREFVIRHTCSAFSSSRIAFASSDPGGTSRTTVWTFSILSRTASTSQRIEIHSSFAARATALNDKMKQSAIAADSSVSGDHRSPGPPNSAGPADSSASSPGLVSSTLLSRLAEAVDL